MYLICYGTRPEIIKVFPVINAFAKNKIKFNTLFSGQHQDLFTQFKHIIPTPTFILDNIMTHNQTLNQLSSKILNKIDTILLEHKDIQYIIVQGDTTTAYSIAMAGFHHKKTIIHLEAGLRTFNKYSPYPEEINRALLSRIADIHLCPTEQSIVNLQSEGIANKVYLIGNTVVDAFEHIVSNYTMPHHIQKLIQAIVNKKYYIVTLHRRENRGDIMKLLWNQLNTLSSTHTFIYITHPSLPEAYTYLKDTIIKMDPQDYISMVFLIKNSAGIITDSGGLQEEAVCAKKKVLVCRNTTERPETISSGWGKLIHTNILNNIEFLDNSDNTGNTTGDDSIPRINPYGTNVCDKIINIVQSLK
tara:strand:- start:3622 stop:4698 length:1077 start_codon:yes stop_codon:yes gene_type:complete